MDADTLRDRLIEIAQMDPLEQDDALKALQAECKDAEFTVNMPTLRNTLKRIMSEATGIAAEPVVDLINQEWFIIGGDGAARFARWEEGGLQMYTKASFAMLVAPLSRLTMGHNPEDVYLRSDDRRLYTGVTIDASAGAVVDGKVNLWQGYGVEPTLGDAALFLDYLKAVFPDEWEYILNWCAWVVQNPDKRIEVALFLVSRAEGTGKSTLGLIFRRIFGRHAVMASKSSDLIGKFNGHLASALFIHGNEILFRGNKQGADHLKTIITDDRLRVEPKGLASFEKDNHISMLLTSNHDHAAHIGPSDRRYAFAEASDTLRKKTSFWVPFYEWLDSGGVEIIADHLLGMDLSAFDPQNDRPLSDLYMINKRGSLQQTGRWWRDCIDAEELLGSTHGYQPGQWSNKNPIYRAYVTAQRVQHGYADTVDASLFWKDMKALGAMADTRKRHGKPREVKLVGWAEADANLFRSFT